MRPKKKKHEEEEDDEGVVPVFLFVCFLRVMVVVVEKKIKSIFSML